MPSGIDLAKAAIRESVSSNQLIDLVEMLRASRKDAGEHTLALGLTGAPAARIAGLSSYEVATKRFNDVVALHGGLVINGECFPGTELRNYQTIGRFGRLILGKASIIKPGSLPKPNYTRRNGATLNRPYTMEPDMFRPLPEVSSDTPIYALLLTCADRKTLSQLHEIGLAVLEPNGSAFVFYEEVDVFLAGYGLSSEASQGAEGHADFEIGIKPDVEPFVGGEAHKGPDEVRSPSGK